MVLDTEHSTKIMIWLLGEPYTLLLWPYALVGNKLVISLWQGRIEPSGFMRPWLWLWKPLWVTFLPHHGNLLRSATGCVLKHTFEHARPSCIFLLIMARYIPWEWYTEVFCVLEHQGQSKHPVPIAYIETPQNVTWDFAVVAWYNWALRAADRNPFYMAWQSSSL